MPRDSNGVYSLPSGYLAVTGNTIEASQHNPPLEDIADGLTNSLPRNGAAAMTGDLKMGGNGITGLEAGTASAPSISPTGDTNTGVYFPGADELGIATGGTVRILWTATTVTASLAWTFSGAVALSSTLAVTGASTLSGNTTVGGTFGVTGAATFSSTLSVGAITTSGNMDGPQNFIVGNGEGEEIEFGGGSNETYIKAGGTTRLLAFTGGIIVEGSVAVKETTQGTPASGYAAFFAKSDGLPYFKNDAGTEYGLTLQQYTSSNQTITGGGSLTLAHSLGSTPKIVQAYAKNISGGTVNGYANNQEVMIPIGMHDASSGRGLSVWVDSTNVNVRFGSSETGTFQFARGDSGASFNITNNQWALVIKAFA